MKVAIVPDWLTVDGGAEKVLRAMIEVYPDADIFTLVDFLTQKDRETILFGKSTTTSFLQNLPFAKDKFRNYLPLFPKAIESLDLSGYDLIVSSSWAVAKGVKHTIKQIHICYCQTPIRYAWDMYDEYTKDLPIVKKQLVSMSLKYIRRWDIKTLDRVDFFIANSNFIKKRIYDTYKRDAIVIHPPVDTTLYTLCEEKDDFYLTASRLVPYKKTKMIVEAFNESGKRLVVIGSGEELESIKKIAKENITLLGFVDTDTMVSYMQRAKAFVYAALEDFGIVPIEALSCGTPVIAYGKGGVLDSVKHKENGYLFDEQTPQSIIDAVKEFEEMDFDYKYISDYAKMFSKKRFQDEFKSFVNVCIKERDV
jgi:glycosyltransferase involved in cell wall biosynthesis